MWPTVQIKLRHSEFMDSLWSGAKGARERIELSKNYIHKTLTLVLVCKMLTYIKSGPQWMSRKDVGPNMWLCLCEINSHQTAVVACWPLALRNWINYAENMLINFEYSNKQ